MSAETGATHQIRIHLAEIGHPLCGEKIYLQPLFRQPVKDASERPEIGLACNRTDVSASHNWGNDAF